MKTKAFTSAIVISMFFALFNNNVFAQASNALAAETNQNSSIDQVKSITARYISDKVFLCILTNGIKENTCLYIERSVDGKNFEKIGMLNCVGTNATIDLAYYFTDNAPLQLMSYYRLVNYSANAETYYSQNISVAPVQKTQEQEKPVTLVQYVAK